MNRHIGPNEKELEQMLDAIGVASLEQLIDETIPANIRLEKSLNLPQPLTEYDYLKHLKQIAQNNQCFDCYIGMGYYPTITPSVILRNLFENPGWYTPYTPYQAEIAQGRLEALLNFQTMIADLTAMPLANASLLDEGTAAAEAMNMFYGIKNKKVKGDPINEFVVSSDVHPQTIDVLTARAEPLGIKIICKDEIEFTDQTFGILLQYPGTSGNVIDFEAITNKAKAAGVFVTIAADLLSLCLLKPPGEWGADCVVGNAQRFGVPMGFGGPHAAFFATMDEYKRQIPGRIIGVSIDSAGNNALRMALQTREQHIRRDKATSNICTAQALLAVMSSMYAVYHGPDGLRAIASRIHKLTCLLEKGLNNLGFEQVNSSYFDTLRIPIDKTKEEQLNAICLERKINLCFKFEGFVQISMDETKDFTDVQKLMEVFALLANKNNPGLDENLKVDYKILPESYRSSDFMTHPVFNSFHSESKMMRYLKKLENKDLSLVHSMISLGSCTMKLNAATQMIPVSWPEFSSLHPFVPKEQTQGYLQIIQELEAYLCEITGFAACSLMSNSGAQGEYAGLLTIRAYHHSRNEQHRNIVLIPSSAHGTNPASAVLAAFKVVVTKCDEKGNLDFEDLAEKAEMYKDNLAALMVTYPSTHGVFESNIKEVCDLIHQYGGKVYMDGANMNAQVGLTSPGNIHADVCHLNLHKTFSIPHGGGGPGMGPICVKESLAPFLPNHIYAEVGGDSGLNAVASAPWGSASILLISYAYIRLLGAEGCERSTVFAILNANYIKSRLDGHYSVLYTGDKGRAAHELILELRDYKKFGITAEDVAKRLMDYGFHAPTLSFPVDGTIMIEPTESEDKSELDRFCDALIQIKSEIEEVVSGVFTAEESVLCNAPHTQEVICSEEWTRSYSRTKAAFPLEFVKSNKFWPTVGRVNNPHGDKNLICACLPLEAYV